MSATPAVVEAVRLELGRAHLSAAAMFEAVAQAAEVATLRAAAEAYGPAQISGFFTGRDDYTRAWLAARADQIEGET